MKEGEEEARRGGVDDNKGGLAREEELEGEGEEEGVGVGAG